MPSPTVPTKTPLGQEEMRRRTGGLGQRHRTILFLIDGRRTLAEVLGLAHQAGAATSHFEDLVRLGYVELPPEEPPAPPPEAVLAPTEGQITHLEVVVPADARAAAAEAGEEQAPAGPVPVFGDTVPMSPLMPSLPEAGAAPPLLSAAPAVSPRPGPAPLQPAAPRAAPAPPPALYDEDAPLLERARACLLETIRVDSQPASARIAERARQAQTLAEMIEVVWVLERGLNHSQRSHRGLLNLQKARELLGLGNTLVDEDSRPSHLDEDGW
ncbi:MAG: hypothetical protein KF788_01180 [Piscinibacter sp.]|nr:hypothetical protein [Piscinibacter sp.]